MTTSITTRPEQKQQQQRRQPPPPPPPQRMLYYYYYYYYFFVVCLVTISILPLFINTATTVDAYTTTTSSSYPRTTRHNNNNNNNKNSGKIKSSTTTAKTTSLHGLNNKNYKNGLFYAPSSSFSSSLSTVLYKQRQQQPLLLLPIIKKTASISSSRSSSSTRLQLAGSSAGIGVLAGAVSGGLFAGGLHAIAGPDHLAALLPRCCGQRWFKAGRVGALWGMGHGLSATLLGVTAFAVKRTVGNNLRPGMKALLSSASHITEVAVGLSLILIGLMGIKEAREWEDDHETTVATTEQKSLSAAVVVTDAAGVLKVSQKRAVIFNGILHGFSWDGAPSLAPAIAVATWGGNLTFLSAYALGTIITMAAVTTLVGEGTRRASEVFKRPDLPQKLSIASSILAIGIGTFWCRLAFI